MIRKAVKILSKYKSIDLSAYKSVSIENIHFIHAELENLEKTCIKASDVLNCITAGISTAFSDRIPYNNTPVLVEITGALGVNRAAKTLPYIPYAGITMAGVCWGISGNIAKTKAQEESIETKIETERMLGIISGLRAIERRIDEGENLLFSLSKKLKYSLTVLQSLSENDSKLSDKALKEIDTSVWLIKSIKQVIETDICNANGFLTKKSGVIFRKIEKEINDV